MRGLFGCRVFFVPNDIFQFTVVFEYFGFSATLACALLNGVDMSLNLSAFGVGMPSMEVKGT